MRRLTVLPLPPHASRRVSLFLALALSAALLMLGPSPAQGQGAGPAAPGPIQAAIEISQTLYTDTPTDARWVVLSRDDEFADSLAGSSLAGSGPLLLTPGDTLTDTVAAEIDRVLGGSGTVYLLGGTDALSDTVSDAVVGAGYSATRLDGPTRVETAVAVAEEVGAQVGSVPQIALARADAPADRPTAAWADSIAAGAWAAENAAPILLTPSDNLHPAVQDFVDSATDSTVTALGGTEALSDQVVTDAGAARVDGPNRFATAAAIASELFSPPPEGFVVGDGGSPNGWAYLLPAAGLAARTDAAILLAEADRAPAETVDRICQGDGTPAPVTPVGPLQDDTVDALGLCGDLFGVFDLPGANSAEGIASGPEPRDFFAGELNTGDIFRGTIAPGSAERFIEAPDGRMAVGLAYDGESDWLFVAGGMTGQAFVYDASSGEEIAAIDIGQGFINDVTITDEGAWFTNSVAPTLTLIPREDTALGNPVALALSGPASDTSSGFNLNGITAPADGSTLLVAHSGNGEIVAVDPTDGSSATVDGAEGLVSPDGILLVDDVLYVVENAANRVAAITLSDDLGSATSQQEITNPAFDVPTTIASFGDRLAIVNAKFSTPNADSYEVVVFPR